MRRTSDRRRAPTRRKYRGNPGDPLDDRGLGPYVTAPGEPFVWCPACELPIRRNPTGTMHRHAAGGHRPNNRRGIPPCLGSVPPAPDEPADLYSKREARERGLVTRYQLVRTMMSWTVTTHARFPRTVGRLDAQGRPFLWDAAEVRAWIPTALAHRWILPASLYDGLDDA